MVSPAVPELTEEVLHESTDARTESLPTLRELGPPDLVQLIKQTPRSPGKQSTCGYTLKSRDLSKVTAWTNGATKEQLRMNCGWRLIFAAYSVLIPTPMMEVEMP
ncbi:hypothetical protein DH86_00001055 [Scytalidium sp. 3C]|nr:hypothetical protein DH86_00001055 [Scytalidium sp. 3C]